MENKKEVLFVLLILIGAIFFRFYKLGQFPPGLYPDEAINANEAWQSLETKKYLVFYPENNGREGLFIWLLSLSFFLFGPSIVSARIVPAFLGSLTVLGIYLLSKELFFKKENKKEIALLSTLLFAFCFWHLNFSRILFRAILVPFFSVFGFYFLFFGFRTKKIASFLMSGVFLGLGFYSYISYRFIVPVLFFALLLIFIFTKNKNEVLRLGLIWLGSVFIVALPIGIYFLQNPHYFLFRASGISIFNQENPFKAFIISLISHLAMFNIYGDPNWRHNISSQAVLFFPVGILFLVGLFYSLSSIVKEKLRSPAFPYLFLLFWWLIMLFPGILTIEGIPHSLRTIGSLPPTIIFAGLGSILIREKLKRKKVFSFFFAKIMVWVLIFLFIGIQYYRYFYVWGKNQNVKDAFSSNLVELGCFLNQLGREQKKYVIVTLGGVPVPYPDGIPMPSQTPLFIEISEYGSSSTNYLLPEEVDKIIIEKNGVILLMTYEQEIVTSLFQKFPQGEFKQINGFYAFFVNQ